MIEINKKRTPSWENFNRNCGVICAIKQEVFRGVSVKGRNTCVIGFTGRNIMFSVLLLNSFTPFKYPN